MLFGGYGTSVTGLNINNRIIASVYGGGQSDVISVIQSWRVKKGDVVVIQKLVDITGVEINVHKFVPYIN